MQEVNRRFLLFIPVYKKHVSIYFSLNSKISVFEHVGSCAFPFLNTYISSTTVICRPYIHFQPRPIVLFTPFVNINKHCTIFMDIYKHFTTLIKDSNFYNIFLDVIFHPTFETFTNIYVCHILACTRMNQHLY